MDLQIFTFENSDIRTTVQDDEVWFVAKDVCEVLDIANVSQAVSRLDDDERRIISTYTNKGARETLTVNESGLYGLVLSSRKPEARQFQRWVRKDVLPVIRKHGAYVSGNKLDQLLENPEEFIELLMNLKEERVKRMELEQKQRRNQPKIAFAEALEASDTTISVGQLAKILKQNGIDIGRNKLFQWLRENGYLCSRADKNEPTQLAMELGLFEVSERIVMTPTGSFVSRTPRVTGKGQTYFLNKFLKANLVKIDEVDDEEEED